MAGARKLIQSGANEIGTNIPASSTRMAWQTSTTMSLATRPSTMAGRQTGLTA
ncbi:hypothetical protein ABGB18_24225 [Nonomuraea sp. B12E4]|uniref:hypothetical protein n=1 Tax=Nonomuraea sp. B12E4 TaxID=3153564 RepID=UPI00325DC35C